MVHNFKVGSKEPRANVFSYDLSGVPFLQVNKGMYDSAKTLASKDQAKGFPVARPVRGEERQTEGGRKDGFSASIITANCCRGS